MSPESSFVSSASVSSNDAESPLSRSETSQPTSTSAPSALGNLVSSYHRQLFDVLDKLSTCGLPDELSLPQLVVCGDQSSGKSSVLEALTEIDFPRDDNQACTRFATQISLRRARNETLVVTIHPHKDRSSEEKAELRKFGHRIDNFKQLNAELGRVIERAKVAMGISQDAAATENRGFSKDILNIEVSGPGREHLTLVDLPGLVRTNFGKEEQLVEAITQSYVKEARTICLPVVNAANDIANQGILKIVRAADTDGHRTMGIVARPDRAEEGSNQSSFYVRLVCNDVENYKLAKGWHVLRNRSQQQQQISFAERNEQESNFFETSVFRSVQPDHRGIDALRKRLSSMLFQHAQRELPNVRKEIVKLIQGARSDLQRLGPERVDARQCREYLVKVANKAQLLSLNAEKGIYEDAFFSEENEPFSERPNWAIRRLRAIIKDNYENFCAIVMERGHTYRIKGDPRTSDFLLFLKSKPSLQKHASNRLPLEISQQQMINRVSKKITANSSQEMQGDSNPFVVKDLFRDQSQHWEAIAQEHVDDISHLCESFMLDVLDETCAKDVGASIRARYLHRTMRSRRLAAGRALKTLIRVMRDHTFDCSMEYRGRLDHIRTQRLAAEEAASEREGANQPERPSSSSPDKSVTPHRPQEQGRLFAVPVAPSSIERSRSPSGRPIRASQGTGSLFGDTPVTAPPEYHETVDRVFALYETKRTTFIDMVNSLVVEDNLVRDIAKVLSPDDWVESLSEAEVLALARETDEVHNRRTHLQQLLDSLEEGQRVIDSLSMSV